MKMKLSFLFFLLLNFFSAPAQPANCIYVKDALKQNRERLYQNLLKNTIEKNLSTTLYDNTEENWMDAFWAMELIRYKSPWAENRIRLAFDTIQKRTVPFQVALLELLYANYPGSFYNEINTLLSSTDNPKVFALCAEYLFRTNSSSQKKIQSSLQNWLGREPDNAILHQLAYRLRLHEKKDHLPNLSAVCHHSFFLGATLVISFQRKNRDHPGLAAVRDSAGNFIKDSSGQFFSVPQLARSVSNLPGYLSNGNTPQGIFRMKGFAVSRSNFIGPTANIQLTLPCEASLRHFMNDSTITDSVWNEAWYRRLLPQSWQQYEPLYEAFYAGKAGRTEIIAHGTTINPAYYSGQPYYPHTPSLGCLCTKEIWSEANGCRMRSDQQKLVDALRQGGGADGYYLVIELNDEQRPVLLGDIQSLLK